MTARSGTVAQVAGLLAIAFTVLLIAGIAGNVPLIVVMLLVGIATPFVASLCDVQFGQWWMLPAVLTATFCVSLAVLTAARHTGTVTWTLPLVLFAVISLAALLSRMTKRRCALCHRRLGPHAITFGCPRCGLEVCDEFCWNFEHRRCRMCEENRVPILPAQSQWWDRQLGPRVQHGRCQLCMASPEQSDLRSCGHCHRPQCRDCWDQTNGECSRCGWTMPNLPKSLETVAVHLPVHMER
ncbi:MAG TPA: hypothetical protein VFA02_13795 [Pseudacidobacterium sp.]|nr:hypothetical protein [Pseudacidobacterium sp.]